MRRQILAAAALLAAATLPAQAAHLDVSGDMLTLTGQILPGDSDALRSLLADANIKRLRLDSPGGRLDEALTMGDAIFARHLDTEVSSGGLCASACFVLLMSGQKVFANERARIGIHQSTVGDGKIDWGWNEKMVVRLYEMGVPVTIMDIMSKTNPGSIYWLSKVDEASAHIRQTDDAGRPVAYDDQTKAIANRNIAFSAYSLRTGGGFSYLKEPKPDYVTPITIHDPVYVPKEKDPPKPGI